VISSKADDKSVIRALEFGAVDFLPKPLAQGDALEELKFGLIEKVKLFAPLEMAKVKGSLAILEQASKANPLPHKAGQPAIDVVAVGSSTGGPPALQAIITKLPVNFPAAIVVSQHMPANFTRFFAERLDKLAAVEVKEAENGDLLQPGRVLIAPGGSNMTFGRTSGGISAIIQKPRPEDKYVPSVDIMMKSAALHYGSRVMGIILTGMGNDGKEGMGVISGLGGPTLAESKETAVIYGMPKEAVEAGFVDKVVPLGQIAGEIIKACG
jgi:two-component system chemotaxis response regulator CheB